MVAQRKRHSGEQASLSGLLILIVDDDMDIRELLCEALTHEGLRTISAADGVEALERCRAERPAVILLDLMMPRLDGRGFLDARAQDSALREVPVIAMSASSTASSPPGANAWLSKPFDIRKLVDLIASLVAPRAAVEDAG